MAKVMPFVEILAAVGFYHKEFAMLLPLLVGLVSQPSDLWAVIEYVDAYFTWFYDNIDVPTEALLLGFVGTAYAFPRRAVVNRFLVVLRRIEDAASQYAVAVPGERLQLAIRELNEIAKRDLAEARKFIFNSVTLKAFFLAQKLGARSAQGLRNFRGSRLIDAQALYRMVGELPPKFYQGELGQGLAKIFLRIGSSDVNSIGYAFQVRGLQYFNSIGRNISKIETKVQIRAVDGTPLGRPREYDHAFEVVDGVEEFHDMKAWAPSQIQKRIRERLGWDAHAAENLGEADAFMARASGAADDAVEAAPGSLYKDIVQMYVTRDAPVRHVVKWGFAARFAEAGLSSQIVEGMIIDAVKHPNVKASLMLHLQIAPSRWNQFVNTELPDLLRGIAYSVPR